MYVLITLLLFKKSFIPGRMPVRARVDNSRVCVSVTTAQSYIHYKAAATLERDVRYRDYYIVRSFFIIAWERVWLIVGATCTEFA